MPSILTLSTYCSTKLINHNSLRTQSQLMNWCPSDPFFGVGYIQNISCVAVARVGNRSEWAVLWTVVWTILFENERTTIAQRWTSRWFCCRRRHCCCLHRRSLYCRKWTGLDVRQSGASVAAASADKDRRTEEKLSEEKGRLRNTVGTVAKLRSVVLLLPVLMVVLWACLPATGSAYLYKNILYTRDNGVLNRLPRLCLESGRLAQQQSYRAKTSICFAWFCCQRWEAMRRMGWPLVGPASVRVCVRTCVNE